MSPTIESPSLTDEMQPLSAHGAGRNRSLHRLIDLRASRDAASALHAAAATPTDGGVLSQALVAANAIVAGGPSADPASFDRLRDAVSSPRFLALVPDWVRELRGIASSRPDSGACTLATALELWLWTMNHFRAGEGSRGASASRAIEELSDAASPLLAARALAVEVANASLNRTAESSRADFSQVYAAHVSALTGAACAELVFGYRRHLGWDAEGCASCYDGDDLDDLEALMPGIASGARMGSDVVEADGSHPAKRGPCARFDGLDTFMRLRSKLDGCLTGARIAKDRLAVALAQSDGGTTPSMATKGTA